MEASIVLGAIIGVVMRYDAHRTGELAASFFRPVVVLWMISEAVRILRTKKNR